MGISRRKPFSLREKLNKLSSSRGAEAGWRTQLAYVSRQRIVNNIMDTLRRHLPFSSEVGLNELRRVAARFEEKIYNLATSQPDYLRRISLKMLSMESRPQNARPNLPSNSASSSSSLPATATKVRTG